MSIQGAILARELYEPGETERDQLPILSSAHHQQSIRVVGRVVPPPPVTGLLELVLVHPHLGRVVALEVRFETKEATPRHLVAAAVDRSGLIDVDLKVDRSAQTYTLNIRTNELEGRPLSETIEALRFLRRMSAPLALGVAVPGGTPAAATPLPGDDPPISEEFLQLLEALDRVARYAQVEVAIPPAITVGAGRAIEKADRLLAGEIVRHKWSELVLHVKANHVEQLLNEVMGGAFALEIGVPYVLDIAGSTLEVRSRSMRILAATVTNREEALWRLAQREDPVSLHLAPAPGITDAAESRLGEFAESVQEAGTGRRLLLAKAGRSGRSDVSAHFRDHLWAKMDGQ